MGFTVLRTFKLLYTVYVYDEDEDVFKPLPDMPEDLPLQIFNARKALALIDAGEDSLPLHLQRGCLPLWVSAFATISCRLWLACE